jgi:hypothetical protein
MKKPWHLRRTVIARDDGERRWDTAYQCLLAWTSAREEEMRSVSLASEQEEPNGSRPVYSGLNRPATAAADD